MEDAAIAHSSLSKTLINYKTAELPDVIPQVTALYAVFDGHSGSHAAEFASDRILRGVTASGHFPRDIGASLTKAFVQIDQDYLAALNNSGTAGSGTTALAAVVWGNTLYVANAGDSRAVLSRSGKAIELTRDHKPQEPGERQRIELCGGYVCSDGRLCGELGVARAIGDYHFPNLKGVANGETGPLTAEPEVSQYTLGPDDEFMLLGCDGLWDVLSSQRAVEFARIQLKQHNDPQQCAAQLVAEAVRMHSSDNVTVIVVCFGKDPPKRRVYGTGRFSSHNVSDQGLSRLATLLGAEQH
jgi:protein phosphatase 2C family protein 2/3